MTFALFSYPVATGETLDTGSLNDYQPHEDWGSSDPDASVTSNMLTTHLGFRVKIFITKRKLHEQSVGNYEHINLLVARKSLRATQTLQ